MNRRVIAVLVCTFLALLAATLWLPVESTDGTAMVVGGIAIRYDGQPARQYIPAWRLGEQVPDMGRRYADYADAFDMQPAWRIRWSRLALTLGLIVALGGLSTLALRIGAARTGAVRAGDRA